MRFIPNHTRAALLSIAFPEVSAPNGLAETGVCAIPVPPGAGEHKRMEISTAFVSAVEVMMTVRCCRCVHVE